jgi:hypothetical protein
MSWLFTVDTTPMATLASGAPTRNKNFASVVPLDKVLPFFET